MSNSVYIYDPTLSDKLSQVRGIGRYLQILKENFFDWIFTDKLSTINNQQLRIFINPFFNFLKAPPTIRRIAKKQIAVIHDLIPIKYPEHFPVGIKGKINFFLNKLALKNYDLIVTDSETSKKDIMKILGIKETKIKAIYPCLPKVFTNQRLNHLKFENWDLIGNWKLEIGNSFCLYVGDSTWNKNLVNLAKAIKIINVTCVFVGNVFNPLTRERVNELTSCDKWQHELKQFLNETKNDKRFIFLGFVPDEQLIELYKKAKLNILVSRDEGFGFSYLEASSQSCPSVVSDTPIFHEISDGKGVYFADQNDPNDIANKIGEIYFHTDLREKLGREVKKRLEYFGTDKFKKQWLEIVQ